ncbi:MAG: bifunctional glutamate N-acetyltransferase/amino-acid acetyltransferase ArgJ, partial [Pelagibacterales bacterium]|nr:bifunctional glutamate N-acetyltransferase/amino-acid acetyltransferase ArgJ [Pelagibacterales bacterium]
LITNQIENLVKNSENNEEFWHKAAKAIMTTDTKEKSVTKTCEIDSKLITINGFAKGSGMIAPNMATMLGYIFCDANISSEALSSILKEITEDTFNAITVDSDQSTNDTVLLFATKIANNSLISNASDSKLDNFKKVLKDLMLELAQMIVIDGEGAKKLIEITVKGAANKKQAKEVALSIGNSPLVKTAIAGCDPNWGRIVMAVGKSCSEASPEKLVVKIGNYELTKDGAKHPNYVEKLVHEYLKNSYVLIEVDLAIKKDEQENCATIWTCDLNEEYIKINKDYRS